MSLISTVGKKSWGSVTMHCSEIPPLRASLWALKKPPWSPATMSSWMSSPGTELEGPMRKTSAGTEMLVGKVMLSKEILRGGMNTRGPVCTRRLRVHNGCKEKEKLKGVRGTREKESEIVKL